MGLLNIFTASNPIIAAGASIALDKLGGPSRSAGEIVDASEYSLSAAKDRAMGMVQKAKQQAEEKPKYKASGSKATDMNVFVREAVLPAFKEAPDFKSQLIAQLKKQGMPNSVIKEVDYDFKWTETLEGKRV